MEYLLPIGRKCSSFSSSVYAFYKLAHYAPLLQGIMKTLFLYCDFKNHLNHLQSSTLETESLLKRLEESKAKKARFKELLAQQENELLLSAQQLSLTENKPEKANSKVSEANYRAESLEAKLMAIKGKFEKLGEDHSILGEELKQILEKCTNANLQCISSEDRITRVSLQLKEA